MITAFGHAPLFRELQGAAHKADLGLDEPSASLLQGTETSSAVPTPCPGAEDSVS